MRGDRPGFILTINVFQSDQPGTCSITEHNWILMEHWICIIDNSSPATPLLCLANTSLPTSLPSVLHFRLSNNYRKTMWEAVLKAICHAMLIYHDQPWVRTNSKHYDNNNNAICLISPQWEPEFNYKMDQLKC